MIKKMIRRMFLGEKADSESYIAYLKKKGIRIGDNVRFYSPMHTHIDVQNPNLLIIGDDVIVAHGVSILTHDGAWLTLSKHPDSYGAVMGGQAPVKIGNNVFLGFNATINRGVTIGDHVIIGAGSVVIKDCESNSIYAGNPARKIIDLETYRKKLECRQFDEAKTVAHEHWKRYGTKPPKELFSEYFPLFCTVEEASACPVFRRQMCARGDYEASVQYLTNHPPMFSSFESFLDACDLK